MLDRAARLSTRRGERPAVCERTPPPHQPRRRRWAGRRTDRGGMHRAGPVRRWGGRQTMKRGSGWSSAETLGEPAGCLAVLNRIREPILSVPGSRTGRRTAHLRVRSYPWDEGPSASGSSGVCRLLVCHGRAGPVARARTPHCRGTSSPALTLRSSWCYGRLSSSGVQSRDGSGRGDRHYF